MDPFKTPTRKIKAQDNRKPPAKVHNTHSTLAANDNDVIQLEDMSDEDDGDYVQEEDIVVDQDEEEGDLTHGHIFEEENVVDDEVVSTGR